MWNRDIPKNAKLQFIKYILKPVQLGPIDRVGRFPQTELEIKYVENKLEFKIC
jgi:hypothetical protein